MTAEPLATPAPNPEPASAPPPAAEVEPAPPRPSLAARTLILLVRLYQLTLSHLIGGHCRYTPSCSNYGLACLRLHGALRGSYYTFRRLCRCHPFHPGGYDPPPGRRIDRASSAPAP